MILKMYNKYGAYELVTDGIESALNIAKREMREGRANRADISNARHKVLAILTRKAFGRVEVAFAK